MILVISFFVCTEFSFVARVLSPVAVSRGTFLSGIWASHFSGFSCGSWVLLLLGMWELPGPGIELEFPALAGGFLTTEQRGQVLHLYFRRSQAEGSWNECSGTKTEGSSRQISVVLVWEMAQCTWWLSKESGEWQESKMGGKRIGV